jgi:hypothetical protein
MCILAAPLRHRSSIHQYPGIPDYHAASDDIHICNSSSASQVHCCSEQSSRRNAGLEMLQRSLGLCFYQTCLNRLTTPASIWTLLGGKVIQTLDIPSAHLHSIPACRIRAIGQKTVTNPEQCWPRRPSCILIDLELPSFRALRTKRRKMHFLPHLAASWISFP